KIFSDDLEGSGNFRYLSDAVLVAPAAPGNELEIIHDQEAQTARDRETLSFCADLRDRNASGIVDDNLSFGYRPRSPAEFFSVLSAEVPGPHSVGINIRLATQNPLVQFPLAHLQAKNRNVFSP